MPKSCPLRTLTFDLVSRCLEVLFVKYWYWSEAQSLGLGFGLEPLSLGLRLEKLSLEAKPGIWLRWFCNKVMVCTSDKTTDDNTCVYFIISFGNPAVDERSILSPLKQCKQYVCFIHLSKVYVSYI